MIKILDNKNAKIAAEILALQKTSYRVEANIIGFDLIPPLLEYLDDIMSSNEIYCGYYEDNILAGIVAYSIEGEALDIYKVAVHPRFFKRGIATKLIKYVEQNEGITKLLVATGLYNTPAVSLYKALGFIQAEVLEVQEGIRIVSFEKNLK